MLKALEIVGFKSFADKTRLEFPRGITVVVGPNGSGKSNVVDAIKWVLGEQSVKSLRGKEMADVIFNGSGTRRPMNSAEITLTLDNSSGLLAVDAAEVHITRRVYRSGEGEYLINRQPCRLRDIRDLLAGTGLAAQNYSVIEQGKVDILLQSSPRDRRIILEEAAGISRFKGKKLEAMRRLERVEQNLLRLSDIVDEVDSRLRTVRLQAGKARRYKEYTDRLQELRTQVGLADWRKLSQRLAALEDQERASRQGRDAAGAQVEAREERLLECDARAQHLNEAVRECERQAAAGREQIATAESTVEHERARGRELQQEIARHRRQMAALSSLAGGLESQLRQTAEEAHAAEEHYRQLARVVAQGERQLTEVIERVDQLRGEHQVRRAAHLEEMRSAAALESQISRLESQAAAAQAARERSQSRLSEVQEQLAAARGELEALGRRRQELAAEVEERSRQCSAAQERLGRHRDQAAASRAELAELQQRRGALAERAAVLEELVERREGLSPGVQEVLALARQPGDGPFRHVCGLLADLVEVSVESAPLVEVALGEAAQHVVVRSSPQILEHLQRPDARFGGRVGFLRLDHDAGPQPAAQAALEGRPGVLGRADQFVRSQPEVAPLVRRLLGATWFVETLGHALALAQSQGRGLRFVTLAGELLQDDGTVTVGPRHVSTGLISRRSELRALRSQLAELEGKIHQAQSALEHLEAQIARLGQEAALRSVEHQQAVETLSAHGHKITAAEEGARHLGRQQESLQAECQAAAAEHHAAEASLAAARSRHAEAQAALADMQTQLDRLAEQIDRLETDRQARHLQTTDIKVDLAKSEERLRNLLARRRQYEENQQERQREVAEGREQLALLLGKAAESQGAVLDAETRIAELYLRKETLARQTVERIQQREAVQQDRGQVAADAQLARAQVRKLEEHLHQVDLSANEVRHERGTLENRLREDYGIELAELEHQPSDDEQRQRAEVQEEIDELRRKINNLGNVNLEALEELEQLDARHKTLSEQYRDLADAKGALERIIEKINTDSRQLFADTLQTVKGHFSELFRDLFGGGRVDIVLEEGVDILESGIEIVARPPGKEPRSISLLSGGEKTLTCVALLLAIFRSRPSPFCVLDEVDAALDEANIDRFTKVLRDFLAWTQFIIVTHSKKTMTCADTIYGVTMQESGVSKQVSVRFEDVSDDGEILLPPEAPAPSPQAPGEEQAA